MSLGISTMERVTFAIFTTYVIEVRLAVLREHIASNLLHKACKLIDNCLVHLDHCPTNMSPTNTKTVIGAFTVMRMLLFLGIDDVSSEFAAIHTAISGRDA